MAGKPEPEATPEMTAKMMAKMLECDPKKIDDIMCPNFDAVKALNMKINPPAKNDEE